MTKNDFKFTSQLYNQQINRNNDFFISKEALEDLRNWAGYDETKLYYNHKNDKIEHFHQQNTLLDDYI